MFVVPSGSETGLQKSFNDEQQFRNNFHTENKKMTDGRSGERSANPFKRLFGEAFDEQNLRDPEMQDICEKGDRSASSGDIGNICEWSGCEAQLKSGSSFRHHANYHDYYAKLVQVGQKVLDSCDLPKCCESASYAIPDLDQVLRCEWDSCDVTFELVTELFVHVKGHAKSTDRDVSAKTYRCLWSGCSSASFSNRTRLEEHTRTHTKEKSLACPTCLSMFSTKAKFVDHRKRQMPVEMHSFQCSHCSKSFASVRLLKDHMPTHINNYKCQFCDLTCPKPSTLSKHIRFKHLNSRAFQCYFCKDKFLTKNDLEVHITTHVTEKVNNCDLCSFSCRTVITLERHYANVHDVGQSKIYECHCCKKEFSRGGLLTKHLVKQHDFKRVAGHSRYRYIPDPNDGRYRLETVRLDSIEVHEAQISEQQLGAQQPIPDLTTAYLQNADSLDP